MREGWQTKMLGELGKVITGSTPSTRDESNYSSPDVCFVKPSDIAKTGITTISDTEFHISRKAFQQSRKLPKGSVLTTCIGIIGKVGILGVDATCNQQINAIIPDKKLISSSFLAYSVLSKQHLLSAIANAPVVPIINKGEFSSVSIPVPPIQEQEKIVAELDCLSKVNAKKKQQLEELDKLAQSIFYDMFGDPISNEKGWEMKKLEELVSARCPISYGIVQPGDGESSGIPVVRPVDLRDSFTHNAGLKLTTEEISNAYKRTILRGNELLLCVRGTTGIVSLAANDLAGCNVSRGITPLEFNSSNNRYFMLYQFRYPSVQSIIADLTHGIALKGMNMADVRRIRLAQPPLNRQDEFAQKIEAIEKQKELVKRSFIETKTLFNSRMDYWFNN